MSAADRQRINRRGPVRKRSRNAPHEGKQELAVLQRINQTISATLEVGEVMHRIIAELVALLAAHSASVILHNDVTQEAELITTYGKEAAAQTLRYPLRGSLTEWVAIHHQPLRVPRLTPEEWPAVWRLAEQLGLPPAPFTILLVPLTVQGKVIGSLEVCWEPGHRITDHEQQLLEAVAVQAAIAITNAQLYQEKKHALQALQETHRKVLTILDSMTDAFYTLDRQWRFTYLNGHAERLLRRTQAELLGKTVWEAFPETTRAITNPQFHQAMADQVKVDFEVFYSPLTAWFEVHAYPSSEGLAVYFHDITVRKRTEDALLRLASVVRTSIDSIVLTDIEGTIIEVNDATVAMYGGDDPGDLIGQSAFALIAPEDYARAVAGMGEVLEEGYLKEREYRVLRKDGSIIPVEMSVSLIKDAAGTPIGFASISRDITARRRAAHELQQAKEAAEAASRTKSEFLATMSHELRTPLGIILGYAQLLLEDTFGRLEKEQALPVRRIDRSARELLDLITAVLDLSRLEAGRLPLEMRETPLARLVQEVQGETQSLQEQTSLAFVWEVEPTLPLLFTDAGKLKIVLKNLLGNAVKFTPTGSITVTACTAQEGVEIRVTDTGIGIPPEALTLIFEPFQQVGHALAPRAGGTGLGLYIVKRLLGVLGGTVTVESTVGCGTTFCVWLPLKQG